MKSGGQAPAPRWQQGLGELAAALAAGTVSVRELLNYFLERIERHDPKVGAFNDRVAASQLAEAARASELRRARGRPRSILDGIPCAVKANIAVQGLPWHAGAYRQRRARSHAEVVQALENAGLLVVGTLNMHEAALGVTTNNPWFGRTRNPHDLERIPGGSSGGSAAAVAAGLVPVALGSDSLGSVRLPSAFCGVTGFKPALGRLPTQGLIPLSATLDLIGIHARTPLCVQQVLACLDGRTAKLPPSDHATAPPSDLPGTPGEPGGLAYAQLPEALDLSDEMTSFYADRCQRLEAAWQPSDWRHLDLPASRRAGLLLCELDLLAAHEQELTSNPGQFSSMLREMLGWAAAQSEGKVRQAQAKVGKMQDWLENELRRYRCILLPTSTHLPPRADEEVPASLADLTAPASLAGIPACSVPAATSVRGLPIGLQLLGRDETEVLELATAFYAHCPPPAFAEPETIQNES